MSKPQIYGYLRVSTDQQFLDNNKGDILLKLNDLGIVGTVQWIEETISGTKHWKSRKLGDIIENANKGDIIVMSELSRIARQFLHVSEFLSICSQKDVRVYFTQQNFKLDDSIESNALIFAHSISAQIERSLISSRTKTALQTKKQNGTILGRPKNKSKLDVNMNNIVNQIKTGIKFKTIAKNFEVTPATLTNFIKKHDLKNK